VTWRNAAARVLRTQAAQMEAQLLGVLNDEDPEHLHDLRVALRRARCALHLFREGLGPHRCHALSAELRDVALPLGQLRDLDLLLTRLPGALAQTGADAGKALLHQVAQRRAQCLRDLQPTLIAPRFQHLCQTLHRTASWRGERADHPLAPDVPELIWEAASPLHALRKQKTFAATELHSMRIRFKVLRYSLEFLGQRHLRRIVRFQDCLGDLQDHTSGVRILVDLAREGGLEAARVECLGELAQVERQGFRAREAEFLTLWQEHRGWWKRFKP
jgi:CHAD domain-containing protein